MGRRAARQQVERPSERGGIAGGRAGEAGVGGTIRQVRGGGLEGEGGREGVLRQSLAATYSIIA